MLTRLEVLNITETIDKAEISFSHLRDELIDHVCCEIEHQMKKGFNFHEAFENIKPKVGIRDLEKVQEGTLLLIDKKYRIMKKMMKISGVISLVGLIIGSLARVYHLPGANFILAFGFLILCVLFLPSSISIMRKENKANSKIILYISAYIGSIGFSLGIFFKLMHWPGAAILLTLGIAFLSLVFLPALWFTLNKKLTSKTESIAILAGITGGSLHFIGILFKMQHWPFAAFIYFISVVLLVFVFLPVYSYTKFKSEIHVNEKFIYLIYAFTFFILLTLLIQFQFSYDIFKVFRKDAVTNISIFNYYERTTNKSSVIAGDSLLQSQLSNIIKKVSETGDILDSVNKEFIAILAPEIIYDKRNESSLNAILEVLNNRGNPGIFESVIFGTGENSPAIRIKRNIEEIQGFVNQKKLSEEKCSILNSLLNTTVSAETKNKGVTWEDYTFRNKRPGVQYQGLLTLQLKLKLAEKELLN